jgi:DNA-binding transcriptional LysR family regulator
MRNHGLTVTRLRYLRAMAESDSMSRAAQLAGITLATLSHELTEMEKALGLSLCDRDRRPVVLNAAGRSLACGASDVLDRLDAHIAEAHQVARREAKAAKAMAEARRAETTAARAIEVAPVAAHGLGRLKDMRIAVEDPIGRSPVFLAVAKAFGLMVAARTSSAFDIWPHPNHALCRGTIDFLLEWHGVLDPSWPEKGPIGIRVGDDPFGYVLVQKGDPLAMRKTIGRSELAKRTCYSVDMVRDTLLNKFMKMRLPHLMLVDLESAFDEDPLHSCVVGPASIGRNPPKGYRSMPSKVLETPATLILKLRRDMRGEGLHEARMLAAALRDALLGDTRISPVPHRQLEAA